MLIKIQEGNNIVFKTVTSEQLQEMVKDLYSISSYGMWENKNQSVFIVMKSGIINAQLIEYFLDETTEKYLEKHYGFVPEELNQILSD